MNNRASLDDSSAPSASSASKAKAVGEAPARPTWLSGDGGGAAGVSAGEAAALERLIEL